MALVDGADFAPSEESFAAYGRTCRGFNQAASAWEELKNKDVQALDELLSKNNLARLPQAPTLAPEPNCGN